MSLLELTGLGKEGGTEHTQETECLDIVHILPNGWVEFVCIKSPGKGHVNQLSTYGIRPRTLAGPLDMSWNRRKPHRQGRQQPGTNRPF